MKTNKKIKKIPAEELDERFERGEDVSDYVDWDSATKRFNLEMPTWAIKELDREASRQGNTRQALIRTWIITKLDELKTKQVA